MKFDPHYRRPTVQAQSIDGFNRQPAAPTRTISAGAAEAVLSRPLTRRPVAEPTARSAKKHRLWKRLELPLVLLAGTVAGSLIQTTAFGMLAIAVYGIYALVRRIPSRTTFVLAAMSVGTVTCLLLIKPEPQLVSNFSTYTFLLLVIGVIALLREGRPLKRRKRSRPRSRPLARSI